MISALKETQGMGAEMRIDQPYTAPNDLQMKEWTNEPTERSSFPCVPLCASLTTLSQSPFMFNHQTLKIALGYPKEVKSSIFVNEKTKALRRVYPRSHPESVSEARLRPSAPDSGGRLPPPLSMLSTPHPSPVCCCRIYGLGLCVQTRGWTRRRQTEMACFREKSWDVNQFKTEPLWPGLVSQDTDHTAPTAPSWRDPNKRSLSSNFDNSCNLVLNVVKHPNTM